MEIESGYCYEVLGRNPSADFNRFGNCTMHILRLPNIEACDVEITSIDEQ